MLYRTLDSAEYGELESRILYEDNHILIVNKKCGEIVQGDKTGDEPLGEAFKAFIAQRDAKPGQVFIGVPHRLDRPVSGIVILAKTSKALERLTAMFRDGSIHKTYWALSYAAPQPEEGELIDWMVRNEKQNKSYICKAPSIGRESSPESGIPGSETSDGAGGGLSGDGDSAERNCGKAPRPDAKLARLRYRLAGHTQRYFLIEVQLLTGRHHQIRCQLSNIGCAIRGDLKYGAPRSNADGGICLHSRKVSFIHPVKKTEISVTAPVPSSWPEIQQ